jgi:hypothetical protein
MEGSLRIEELRPLVGDLALECLEVANVGFAPTIGLVGPGST